jgi:hypothetical protein
LRGIKAVAVSFHYKNQLNNYKKYAHFPELFDDFIDEHFDDFHFDLKPYLLVDPYAETELSVKQTKDLAVTIKNMLNSGVIKDQEDKLTLTKLHTFLEEAVKNNCSIIAIGD